MTHALSRLPDSDSWANLVSYKETSSYKKFVDAEVAARRLPHIVLLQ